VRGKSVAEFEALRSKVHERLTQHDSTIDPMSLGKIGALSGGREFPARVKCASLCWHTLETALQHQADPISTE
jgi:nitrogen fixation NifU-like protein